MEFLKTHPHPNIAQYYGCIVKRDRIVGMVLDRYPKTLLQRLKMGNKDVNVNEWFKAISSAISHIHSLGYAHNDICPMNIMIDENGTPFLIDFGSCLPVGSKLMTAGTPGWMEDDLETSQISHDEFSLGKLKIWLANPIDSEEMKYPEV
jgi:serine/threonine protein kinase